MNDNSGARRNTQNQITNNQFSTIINKIANGALIVLIIIMPWIFTTQTEEYYEITKNLVLIIVTFFLIMLWGVNILILNKASFIKSPIDKPIIILTVSLGLSTLFSLNTDTSIWGYHMRLTGGLVSNITLILLFYFLQNNFTNKAQINRIIKLIPISIGVFALFTILKATNILFPILESISSSNTSLSFMTNALFTPVGNPNSLSVLFLIALPFSLFKFLNRQKSSTYSQVIGFSISLLLIIGIGLTSITTIVDFSKLLLWLTITLLLLFSLIYSYRQQNGVNRIVSLNIILMIIALSSFFYSTDVTFRTNITPQTNFVRYFDIPAETSLEVIKGTYSSFPQSVITGTGLNTYANVFSQFRPESQNLQPNWYENYTRSNLQIESILIENGILGIIAYSLLIYFILKFLALNIFKARVHWKSSNILTLSLSSLIFILSLFITHQSITILFYTWISLAFLFKLYHLNFSKTEDNYVADFILINKSSPKQSNNIAPKLFSTILLLIAVTIVYFTTVNYLAETKYSQALKENSNGNNDTAYDLMVNSINLNPNRDYYHREIASIALNKLDNIWSNTLSNQDDTEARMQSEVTKQYLQTLINSEINKAIIIDPENHENWQRAAIIYKKLTELYQGKQFGGEALQAVQKAIEKNPTSPDNYLLLAYLYQYNADPEIAKLAEQAYTKAYKLQPGYFLSIVQLGQYLETQREYELALALYTVSRDEIYYNESDFNSYLNQRIEAMRNALESIQSDENN